jgi:hypothetical protein
MPENLFIKKPAKIKPGDPSTEPPGLEINKTRSAV